MNSKAISVFGAVLGLSMPQLAHADTEGVTWTYADAARAATTLIQSQAVPLFNGGNRLSVSARYSFTSSTPCSFTLVASIPAHSAGGTARAASQERTTLRFGRLKTMLIEDKQPNYLKVYGLDLDQDKGKQVFAGSRDGALRLLRIFNAINSYCTAPGLTGSAPTAYSSRVMQKPDVLGNPECGFPAVPGLNLTAARPGSSRVATFGFKVPSAQTPDSTFWVGGQGGSRVSNWGGIIAGPGFSLKSEAYKQEKITSAKVLVDGRDAGVDLWVGHERGFGSPFSPYVSVKPAYVHLEASLMDMLAPGSRAELRIYNASGAQRGSLTFDISKVRYIPRALEGANWACG